MPNAYWEENPSMSHGEKSEAEADLTPLLDLVLQLLMFFIMNVGFVSAQVTRDIVLPTSESARPLDKGDINLALYLNQKSLKSREFFNNKLSPADQERLRNQDSVVLTPGMPPMTLLECKAWLKDKYEDAQKAAKDGEVKTVINFRPDAELEYNELMKLMNHCKAVGFKKMKVHAVMRGGKS
jgi:biopolymer transport protein ExbD